MECIGCWGSQVEINAAANLLKAKIYIFCKQPNNITGLATNQVYSTVQWSYAQRE